MAHKKLELSRDEFRLSVHVNGEEDRLTSLSCIPSDATEFFVIPQPLSKEKTDELDKYMDDSYNSLVHKINNLTFDDMYDPIEQLIIDGADFDRNEGTFLLKVNRFANEFILKVINLLLKYGFDVNSRRSSYLDDLLSRNGKLCQEGQQLFLDAGFIVEDAYNISNRWSVKCLLSHELFFETLLSSGKITCNYKYNRTPLFFYMDKTMLEKYNKKGEVDQSLLDSNGDSLLSICIMTISKKELEEKLKQFTDIDINTQYNNKCKPHVTGDTLLHKACRSSTLNISKIELLLENGAKLMKNSLDETPIDVLQNHHIKEKHTQVQKDKLQKKINTIVEMIESYP